MVTDTQDIHLTRTNNMRNRYNKQNDIRTIVKGYKNIFQKIERLKANERVRDLDLSQKIEELEQYI